jgi:exopolysaccharide production protein ExoY
MNPSDPITVDPVAFATVDSVWYTDDASLISAAHTDRGDLAPGEESTRALDERSYPGKRLLDIVFASVALLLVLPVIVLLAVTIKLTSQGPVFYRQSRCGRKGHRFTCLKFRTMVPDADRRLAALLASSPAAAKEYAETFKLKADPRVTGVGRFLRRTSLDEIPQFLNVLKGEMSVVGPRPIVAADVDRLGIESHYDAVRPGITGMWQVSGRSNTTYQERVELDLAYMRQQTLRLDLAIIVRTLFAMVRPSGAY